MKERVDVAVPGAAAIELSGLDGANPLAFLAALGTLRMLDLEVADPLRAPTMRWASSGITWHPVLAFQHDGAPCSTDEFLDLLMRALERHADEAPFQWAKNTTVEPDRFRAFVRDAARAAEPGNRRLADFAAAFGCEALVDRQGKVQDTALRTMSGAGHQHFLQSMRLLVQVTEREHLESALFERWAYRDDRPSMRWDPMDDRRYALRWEDPSRDKIRTVRGANRLAIEALPWFPTAPGRRRLETVGFSGTRLRWPVWCVGVTAAVVRSLLSHPSIHGEDGPVVRRELHEMGISLVYESRRITVGKFRNFTPSVAVLEGNPS